MFWPSRVVTFSSPGLSSVISGTCCGRMPISPSMPGMTTIATSSENVFSSGVTISSLKVAMDFRFQIFDFRLGGSRNSICNLRSGLLFDHVDAALHVEILLRHVVMLAVENFFKAAHG